MISLLVAAHGAWARANPSHTRKALTSNLYVVLDSQIRESVRLGERGAPSATGCGRGFMCRLRSIYSGTCSMPKHHPRVPRGGSAKPRPNCPAQLSGYSGRRRSAGAFPRRPTPPLCTTWRMCWKSSWCPPDDCFQLVSETRVPLPRSAWTDTSQARPCCEPRSRPGYATATLWVRPCTGSSRLRTPTSTPPPVPYIRVKLTHWPVS